jgi:hypothetical protein
MGGVVTEEEAIARAQYLDLVYSQSGTLYELIPNATHATNNPSKPSTASHADGVIGSVKTQSATQSTGTIQRPASAAAPNPTAPSSTPPQTQVSDVNAVQSTPSQQLGGKKKAKNKPKKNNNNENPRPNRKPLLPENNRNENRNSHVSFVATITTLETAHIMMKWPNFSRKIRNLLFSLSLFHSNNRWLRKPPCRGAVPTNPMMRP